MEQFDSALLAIDYLVYSSHKTATQTLANTLRANGYGCIHCHSLTNRTVNLQPGTFGCFLEWYHRANGRKLRVMTVFREPVERMASSFFQWHGEGVLRQGLVASVTDTIICTRSTAELQADFIRELRSDPPEGHARIGRPESLDQIRAELGLAISDLNYCTDRRYGVVELDHGTLFVLRFDDLAGTGVETLLSRITGGPVTRRDANISSHKWYSDRYRDFRAALQLPGSVITDLYESRRDIIELMYPGEFDALLSSARTRYGSDSDSGPN